MFAEPAQTGFGGEGFFHDGGRIDKGAVTEWANTFSDTVGQPLQTSPQQLVVVAAKRIAGHERARRIVEERGLSHVRVGLFDVDGVLRGKHMAARKFFLRPEPSARAPTTGAAASTNWC